MKKVLLALTIITLIFIFGTCSFTGDSTVTISPVIRGVTLPSASNISSVELTVSGPGMNTIVVAYDSLPSSIDLSIPSGSNRKFELEVFVNIPIIAATSYKGTATADLSQDSVTIYLTMGVGSTKIVVPDSEWNNGLTPRILQFNDISGAGTLSLNFATLGPLLTAAGYTLSTFAPYDIDFDSEGRIYIANYDGSTDSGIIRVENILGAIPFFISTSGNTKTISIDRENNIIYYNDYSTIKSCDLNGDPINSNIYTGEVLDTFTYSDGFLYIIESGYINKYNINTDAFVNSKEITQFANPWDILVKENNLYVANFAGAAGYQILEISTSNLSLTGHFGNLTGIQDTSKGEFYSPRRFVSQMNRELFIIDDDESNDFDKIIQMDNINGDNWKTLPASGDGQNLFKFFDRGA